MTHEFLAWALLITMFTSVLSYLAWQIWETWREAQTAYPRRQKCPRCGEPSPD